MTDLQQADVNATAASLSFHRRTNPELSAYDLACWAETNLGLVVETGLAMNTNRDPVPHAWNVTADGTVIDGSAHLLGHVEPVAVLGRDKRSAQYIPDVHSAARVPVSPASRTTPVPPAPTAHLDPPAPAQEPEPESVVVPEPIRPPTPAPAPVDVDRFEDAELFAPRHEPAPWDEPEPDDNNDSTLEEPEPDDTDNEPAVAVTKKRSRARTKPKAGKKQPRFRLGTFLLKLALTVCLTVVAVSIAFHVTGYARFVSMLETDDAAFAGYPTGSVVAAVAADPDELRYGQVILVEDGNSMTLRTFSATTDNGFVSMDGDLSAASRTEHTGKLWRAVGHVPTLGRVIAPLNGYGTPIIAGAAVCALLTMFALYRRKKD